MPIHDWTRVDAGIFHHFHQIWVAELVGALNGGVLPTDYYALVEQVTGPAVPDLLTLRLTEHPAGDTNGRPADPGGVAVATSPPSVRIRDQALAPQYAQMARTAVVRHISGDRIVAMIEVVSPGNKGSQAQFRQFVDKAAGLIRVGIHLLVLDLFPPGPRDPNGIHAAVWAEITDHSFVQPPDKPLTLVSYAAGLAPEAFVEPVAVADGLRDMPLFLTPERYVPVPLEPTYRAAWAKVPPRWQQVIID
jgi:hypothetical protein